MLTSGEDTAVTQINSQKPLLTTQEQAIQNSTINGGGSPQSPLLMVDGCWGRQRESFSFQGMATSRLPMSEWMIIYQIHTG